MQTSAACQTHQLTIRMLQALENVQEELDALSSGCNAINAALEADRASSADLLSESDRLQHELDVSCIRSGLVQNFFQQYQLSTAEISALQVKLSSACSLLSHLSKQSIQTCLVQDADIGDAFFDALSRVGNIHKSCRSLLNSHHHRAGLELMDAMSSYQENAYERLCRHVSAPCATQSNLMHAANKVKQH